MMFRLENGLLAVLSWIHCVLLSAAVLVIAACLPVMGLDEASVYHIQSLWMFLPVIVSWFCVRKIRSFPIYLLAGIITTSALFILSGNWICMILSVFVFLMRSYPRVIRGKMLEDYPGEIEEIEIWEIPTFLDVPGIAQWLICIAGYIAIIISGRHLLLTVMFYVLLAEVFVSYIYSSVARMKDFVIKNRRIANLPVGTMRIMQRCVLCVALFFLFLFVLPSIIYGNEPLTFLSELEFETSTEFKPEFLQAPSDAGGMKEMLEMLSAQESFEWPEWMEKLMNVLLYVICAGGMAVIALLLYQGLRKMMQNFANGQGEDEIILLGKDEAELISGIRKKGSRRERSPGMKIRKEYRKFLKKRLKTKPNGWETPSDLEENAGIAWKTERENIKQAEDMTESDAYGVFHDLYEKARYAKDACSKEEQVMFLRSEESLK